MKKMKFNCSKFGRIFVHLFMCLLVWTTFHSTSGFSRTQLGSFKFRLRRCCRESLTIKGSLNKNRCAHLERLFIEELDRITFTRSKSYRYAKKLWRSMSKLNEKYEDGNDKADSRWAIYGYKPEIQKNQTMSFKRHSVIEDYNESLGTHTNNTLTRLELLVPYVYILPAGFRLGQHEKQKDFYYITINGEKIQSTTGTVPQNNLLVFRIPSSMSYETLGSNVNITISRQKHIVTHMRNSLLIEFYNMNTTILEELRSLRRKDIRNENGMPIKDRVRRSSRDGKFETFGPGHFCGLHNYRVNMLNDLHMTNVLHPDSLNIGRCSGKCNVYDMKATDNVLTSRAALLNHLKSTPSNQTIRLKPCCVPYKIGTGNLLIMDRQQTLRIINIPAALIKSCRCV